MSISVVFYHFAKRENSTLRPTASGTAFNCTLKDDCGIMEPRIELILSMSTNPRSWNYAYIESFDRYYFVREWVYSSRKWVALLSEDVLASWKLTIGAQSLYVLRSATAYNLRISDSIYAPLNEPYYSTIDFATGFIGATGIENGTYVLGMVGNSSSAGGIVYYALTGAQMAAFRKYMLSNLTSASTWDSFSSLTGDAVKALVDPFQYVVSCLWFPIIPGNILGIDETIHFGFWDSEVSGKRISDFTFRNQESAARPALPSSFGSVRGEWQYRAPFATYYLYYPPFGIIEINGANITNSGIQLLVRVDLMTGVGLLTIMDQNSVIMEINSAQVGVPVQLSQITTDYGGMLSGAASVGSLVGNILNPFNWGEIADNILGAASGIASAIAPTVKTMGTAGSITTVANLTGYFIGIYLEPESEDIAHYGRPLCEDRVINTLSGYIQVADGDVPIAGTQSEAQAIRGYLEGGFYYE